MDTETTIADDVQAHPGLRAPAELPPSGGFLDLRDSIPIADIVWRHRAQVSGVVQSMRVRPWDQVLAVELVLRDRTGGVTVGFLGRGSLPGVHPGSHLTVEGMVGARHRKLFILNPAYDLRPVASAPTDP
jgi:hypothetical protein